MTILGIEKTFMNLNCPVDIPSQLPSHLFKELKIKI